MSNIFYLVMMFMFFFVFMICSMVMNYLDLVIMMEWMMFSINSLNIEFIILFDWVSLLFVSLILLITSMIMMYSISYMYSEKFKGRFNFLMILFVLSMMLMVISPNMVSILFGWDGLGLVSYCLVIFYQNFMSYNSGMVTVLCNRVGDIGILMSIGLLMMSGGWNVVNMGGFMNMNILMFMLLIAAITKSAQIPFSVWLPMAMAAPTPVSALVHSSTLVTAGVYLMIRFNKFLMYSFMSNILFFLSVMTMFMAGLMANFENDFKKIIALSTLSQLGLMMMVLSLGLHMFAFYHLLIHAIFKSMMFMSAGVIIHSFNDSQDIRLLGNLKVISPFVMISMLISNLALMGFPFMSGFYSKDLIMELLSMMKLNMFLGLFIIMSLSLTVMYSIRFLYYLFFGINLKFYSYYNYLEDNFMNLSMVMLIMMSIFLGAMVNWLFYYDYYIIFMSIYLKFLTIMFCLMGGFMSYLFMKYISMSLSMYYYSYFFSSMWFKVKLFNWIYNPVNLIGSDLFKIDNSWVEYLSKGLILNFIWMKFNNFLNKLYMFIIIFNYSFIMVYMLY